MKLTFLGTSDAIPTKERNHTAVLLSYGSENLLFDCGEGTQRQFRCAGISPTKITRLFISHWHGDHVLGIPGVLQTLALSNYNKKLMIYGPKGTKESIGYFFRAFKWFLPRKINLSVKEITKEGKVVSEKDFSVYARKLKHYNCFGYRFEEKDRRRINMAFIRKQGIKPGPLLKKLQEGKNIKFNGKIIRAKDATFIVKGKVVAFVVDTAYTEEAVKLAKNADVLVCESSYLSHMKDLAKEYSHMTSDQAATIAKKAKVKKLFLTHISARHKKEFDTLLNEAKKVFPSSYLAKDLMSIEI